MSTPLTRRRLLKTAFCSSMALALNIHRVPVWGAEPNDVHLLMIGDYGSQSSAQTAVANALQSYAKKLGAPPEWLLLLGDNFYSKMDGGLASARWQTGFETMYPASSFPGPCPVILGNHDYHDNRGGEQVQLAYAKQGNTRWTMPAKWYRRDLEGVATFLFLDTNLRSVSGGPISKSNLQPKSSLTAAEEAEQWNWIKEQLASKRQPLTIVAGHHPVYSNGSHGDSRELVQRLAPQLHDAGVHLYLCGHDHDLQHLELEGHRTSFVLSGGGGARIRELKNKDREMPFGVPVYGFTHLQLNPEQMVVRHIDANGEQVHAFEKLADHTWRIL